MDNQLITDLITSTERFKLFVLLTQKNEISERVRVLESFGINAIDLGREVAKFLDELEDYSYLTIDVIDYIKKLMDKNVKKIKTSGNDIVAIYNLGILLEPQLELNPSLLLKEFSKTTSLLIIWENQVEFPNRLFWNENNPHVSFEFSDAQLKQLQYAL